MGSSLVYSVQYTHNEKLAYYSCIVTAGYHHAYKLYQGLNVVIYSKAFQMPVYK